MQRHYYYTAEIYHYGRTTREIISDAQAISAPPRCLTPSHAFLAFLL